MDSIREKKVSALALHLLVFHFIFNCSNEMVSQAQNTKSYALDNLIAYFEISNSIKFSFSDKDIDSVRLTLGPLNSTSLNTFLNAIRQQTILSVKKTNVTNYVLYIDRKPIRFCGKIVDGYTNRPLPRMRVADGINETYTDIKGKFSITSKILKNLNISGIGYKTTVIQITNSKQKKCEEIKLYEVSEELEEVLLIQDYLTLGVNKKSDGSIELLPDELKLLPGLIEPDIMQSIQLLPGISSVTDSAADLNIRGGNPDQNLVLWDGIKIYSSGHFFNQISAFNPYITESMKIYKDGTSVQYGDRISGVVDITSISKIPAQITGGAGLNLTTFDANLKIPLGQNVAFVAAGRHSLNQIYDDRFDNLKKKVFQNTNLDETIIDDAVVTDFENKNKFYDFNGKMIWNLYDGSKIQLSTLFMKNSLNFASTLANNIKTEDTVDLSNIGSSLEWKKITRKNIKHKFSLYYTKYDYEFKRNLSFGEDNPLKSNQLNGLIDTGINYSITIPIQKKTNILSGYQYTLNDVKYIEQNDDQSNFFGIQNFAIANKLRTHSLFSECVYENEDLRLQGGIRANYFTELQNFNIEPRLYASFNISSQLQFNLSGELRSQVLRQSYQTSNTRLASIKNAWIIASEETENTKEIPIITSRQFAAGLSYSSKGFGVIFESYLRNSEGLVTLNNDTETINDDLYYVGESTIVGIDLLIKKKIKNYRTWLGYSLSQNGLLFSNISAVDFPGSADATHVLNWSHTLDIQNFELGLSWNYRTGLPYSQPTSGILDTNGEPTLIYSEQNDQRVPNYQSINASLLYSFKWNSKNDWGMKIGISAQNILNRRNIINREYKLAPAEEGDEPELIFNDIKAYQFDNFALPFTPDFLFRITF